MEEPVRPESEVPPAHSRGAAAGRRRLRLLAIALVAGGMALAAWALHSVFQTASTEVELTAPPQGSLHAGPEIGAVAPTFEVPGYDTGGRVRLAAFRGHVVLLNFWASWCAPCRAEAPTLESTYRKYKDRGVVFVGVDLQSDTWRDSRAFLESFHITYPVGRDETGAVGRAYRVNAIPTTYFVSPDGRILTIPITGGFTGKDGIHDLVAQLEKWLHEPVVRPSP